MNKGGSKDEDPDHAPPASGSRAGTASPIEALTAAAFDADDTALFLHDAAFRIVYANPAYAKLAALPREAVLGRPYWEIFPRHDGPSASCRQSTRDRQIRNETLHGPDGRVYRVEHIPFSAPQEGDRYSLHLLSDITAQYQAEQRLKILAQAFTQTGEAVILLDPQFHVLEVNRQFCDWTGRSRQELLGQPWLASESVDSRFFSEAMRAQLEASAPWRGEIELRPRTGPPLPVLATGNAVRDENGTVIAYVFNFSDLREWYEAHKARQILLEVIQDLSGLTSLAEAGELAIRKAVQLVGGDVGGIALYEPDKARLAYRWVYGLQEMPPALFASFKPGEGLAGQAILSGKTEIQNDYQHFAGALPAYKKLGITSAVVVPLLQDGKPVGVMSIASRQRGFAFNGRQRDILEAIARQLVTVRQREALLTALRESENRFHTLFEFLPESAYLLDEQGVVIDVNRKAETLLQIPRQQSLGKHYRDLNVIPESIAPQIEQQFRQALQGAAGPYEFPLRRADGQIIFVEASSIPLRLDGKKYVLGLVRDIRDRKQAETEAARARRAVWTLSKVNEAIIQATDEAALLQRICEVIAQALHYVHSVVLYLQPDAAGGFRVMASAGAAEGYIQALDLAHLGDAELGGPTVRAFRQGEAVVFRGETAGAHADPASLTWQDVQQRFGIRAMIALPICYGKDRFGVLNIYARDEATYQKEEQKILQRLAEDMGFGIHDLRLRAEREQLLDSRNRAQQLLHQSLVGVVEAMAMAVEKRDPYTAGHQKQVALLAVAIGKRLGLSDWRMEGLRLAAMIHDVGKITVPSEILNRPGRLSKSEFEIIRAHPETGYGIVRAVRFPWPVAEMIRQHHERLDGSGYPRGMKDGDILEEARIIAVADVVDAMASHRPYRPSRGIDAAIMELLAKRGTAYDPRAVDAAIDALQNDKLDLPYLQTA